MRSTRNWIILAAITALALFAFVVVWPDQPKRYLPNFVDWPSGSGFPGRDGMRLGLDLKGGTYILLEADTSKLPRGADVGERLEAVKDNIERRVNRFGLSEAEIAVEGSSRLSVQVPGIDPDRARELLGKTAQLVFQEPVREGGAIVCQIEGGGTYTAQFQQGLFVPNPETGLMQCPPSGEGETGTVAWEPATAEDSNGVERVLTGDFLTDAEVVGPPPQVLIEFTGEGNLLFEQITTELVGLPLGIFIDQELISAPNVRQPIVGGQSTITGLGGIDEARTLAVQLDEGALPLEMNEIETREVDATLGDREVVRTVQAGLIGILAIMVFMVMYYRLPGLLAATALGIYISLVMMLYKLGPIPGLIDPVTITLAGVAGFVLSVGMAVDANVLVFERLKEELRAGRSLVNSIENAFRRAWPAIRDSNVATLITCVILYWFGDQFGASLVKGFAITLGLGVLVSMFTALTVTRTFLRLLVGTPVMRRMWLFGAEPDIVPIGPAAEQADADVTPRARRPAVRGWSLDFVRRRGFYYALTAAILLPGIVSLLISPSLVPGIEFTSGTTFTMDFQDKAVGAEDVREVLAELDHEEARVQQTAEGSFIIRMGDLEGLSGPPVGPAPPSERDQIETGLAEALGPFEVVNFNQVSEIVSQEIARDAAIAVAAAAAVILVFISWSFRNVPKAYRYGLAAIVAAGHDALIILGVFSILGKAFGTEINTMFITGLLTIIGFSVHDTIVVFDRIRETATQHPDAPFVEIVNVSLTETLARSLNTSITLLFAVVGLLLLGGSTIQSFLLVLLIGVIAGTYSSIFLASQILVSWEEGDVGRLWRRVFPGRAVPAPEEA